MKVTRERITAECGRDVGQRYQGPKGIVPLIWLTKTGGVMSTYRLSVAFRSSYFRSNGESPWIHAADSEIHDELLLDGSGAHELVHEHVLGPDSHR